MDYTLTTSPNLKCSSSEEPLSAAKILLKKYCNDNNILKLIEYQFGIKNDKKIYYYYGTIIKNIDTTAKLMV